MPWRDIAVRMQGQVVKDLVRHFMQYWNFAKYEALGKSKSKKKGKKTRVDEDIFGKIPSTPTTSHGGGNGGGRGADRLSKKPTLGDTNYET